ncbi:MAG: hypothetical protein HOH33_01695, partial [Verrucomicrobia bacterium]|nr:hypothetical protein [Verrucomicrobiota bacterium]
MFWRYWLVCLMVVLWIPQTARAQTGSNHVLQMNGPDCGARISDDVMKDLRSCTIEAWIRWDDYNRYSQPWSFGTASSSIGISFYRSTPTLQLVASEGNTTTHIASAYNSIKLHQWYHIAAVIDPDTGLRLYINGVLSAENPNVIANTETIAGSGPAWLGVSPWEVNGRFNGALDELRIWDQVRTPAQILDGMTLRASGFEQGLKCVWNFEPENNDTHPKVSKPLDVEGDTKVISTHWDEIIFSPRQWVIHGFISNEAGRPLPDANIQIQLNDRVLNKVAANPDGSFSIAIESQETSKLRLVAHHLTRGIRTNIELPSNQKYGRVKKDLVLKPALNLEGSVYNMDNTPLEHILIEAVPGDLDLPKVDPISSNQRYYAWSNSSGVYQFSNLPKKTYRLRAHLPQGWIGLKLNINAVSGLSPHMIPGAWQNGSLIEIRGEATVRNLDFHIPHFRKARSTTFDLLSNLNEVEIRCMELDSLNRLWVGLEKGGLAVSSETQFEHVPTKLLNAERILSLHNDGRRMWIGTNHGIYWQSGYNFDISKPPLFEPLQDEEIWHIGGDPSGKIWIGTNKGLYYFDITAEEQLIIIEDMRARWIKDVLVTDEGKIWIASWGNGLFEKLPNGWKQWGLYEGLVHQHLSSLMLNDDGEIWIGSDGGLSMFDPVLETFHNETKDTLLFDPYITDILKDEHGSIWVATQGEGLMRYDEGRWTNWANSVILPHQWVTQCLLDPNGDLWVGTHSGLSLLDYEHLKTYDSRDGLTHNLILDLAGNDKGEIWAGTRGKGVFYYDGWSFDQITAQEGLPHDHAQCLHVDKHTGNVWVGTVLGIAELSGRQVIGTYLDSSDQEGEVQDVRDIKTGADHSVWLVSWHSGLVRLDKENRTVQSFGSNQGLDNANSLCLAISTEGMTWVGTDKGLFILNEGRLHIPESLKALEGARVEDVEFDAANEILYIVSNKGIFQFTPSMGLFRISPENAPHLNRGNQIWVSPVHEKVWVGLLGGGMAISDGLRWSTYDTRDGLPHNSVRTIYGDKPGAIWGGTDNGIF